MRRHNVREGYHIVHIRPAASLSSEEGIDFECRLISVVYRTTPYTVKTDRREAREGDMGAPPETILKY